MRGWHLFGASVRGPGHIRSGLPNQDAWLGRASRASALVVVCDGLGSRSHAAAGARAGCRAVADAVRFFEAVPDAPPDLLQRMIHALWNLRVSPLGREHCATTCLFAVALADGRLLIAQLGDGIVVLQRVSGGHLTLQASRERFANETTALGVATSLAAWQVHVEAPAAPGSAVLLATDGISEDLDDARLAALVDHLRAEYGPLPPAVRWRRLTRALHAWPTPRHGDDKTLALLWSAIPPMEFRP